MLIFQFESRHAVLKPFGRLNLTKLLVLSSILSKKLKVKKLKG